MINLIQQPISISDLISVPLTAAIDADFDMAMSTLRFVEELGFKTNSSGVLENLNLLEFTYTVDSQETGTDVNGSNVLTNVSTKSNYKIPLLALVNPPSLRIKNVDIEFSVELDEVTETNSSTTTSTLQTLNSRKIARTSYMQPRGRLTSEEKITKTASSSYKFKINATSNGPNEGMFKVLDLMNNLENTSVIST